VKHHRKDELGPLGSNAEAVLFECLANLPGVEQFERPGISLDPLFDGEKAVRNKVHATG
jgi:hypothetical protein